MDRPTRARRPRWSYAIPWAGRVPELTPRQWSLLGLLGAAELFDQYDVGILGLALKQIQEGLGIPESQIGPVTAVARLGVLPAFALTVLADRLGRRRLLLATIVGLTLSTFATAFAQDAVQFMALQFVARSFIYAETMLAVVVLAEELDAAERGWGIGMLGALGALGHGLA
ncbi:MAG: MFS transporter, partial [Myxococcota bacterium]|nr:MFS transporter [Myxococcota bacterium]